MARKVLVVAVAAMQVVVFTLLALWTVAEWKRIGWTGMAFNAAMDDETGRIAEGAPFGFGPRRITAVAPRSPAARAGVSEAERVHSVDGIDLGELGPLRDLAATARAGDRITYRLERDETSRDVTVELESPFESPFVVAGMASSLVVGALWLLISLLVFWSRPQARTANIFFLLASTGAALYFVWALGELRWPDLRGIMPTMTTVGPWLMVAALAVISILFSNSLLHLALVFPKPRPVVTRWPQVFVWVHTVPFVLLVGMAAMAGAARLTRLPLGVVAFEIGAAVIIAAIVLRLVRAARSEGWRAAVLSRPLAVELLAITIFSHFVPVVRLLPEGWKTLAALGLGVFAAVYLVGSLLGYSALTCVALYRSYRDSGIDVKRQVRWPLWGTLTAVAASIVITLLSLAIGLMAPRLGFSAYASTIGLNAVTKAVYLLIPVSFAFAILKYRLLDIDIIIRKTVIYSGVTGIVLALYLVLAGVSGLVLVRAAGLQSEVATIVATLAVVALFVPIRNRVQAFVDRRFFQRERDLAAARRRITDLVMSGDDLDQLLPRLADESQQALRSRSLAVFVRAGDSLRLRSSVGIPDEHGVAPALPLTGDVFATTDPVADVAALDLDAEPARALRRVRATAVAVARRRDETLGVLSAGSRLDGEPFDGEDRAFLKAVADQLALAIARSDQSRSQDELTRAREIQRSLLPDTVPQVDGVDVTARWQPAREVSGDYFDVLRLDGGRLALCVGDVVGKGMPAALVMSSLQASLKAVVAQTRSPKEVCTKVREVMVAGLSGGSFVTFFFCILDRAGGRLSYCDAGHNPPLLMRADGTLIRLDVGGPILARIVADQPYQEATVAIGPGDRLVLFTDGVTEAMDPAGEMFEEERLEEILLSQRTASAADLERAITGAVLEHARGELQDDLTLVVAAIL